MAVRLSKTKHYREGDGTVIRDSGRPTKSAETIAQREAERIKRVYGKQQAK